MDQSDVVYVMGLVEKESVLSQRVAALELEVKNLTASNSAMREIAWVVSGIIGDLESLSLYDAAYYRKCINAVVAQLQQ